MENILAKAKEIMKEKTTRIAYECWIANLKLEKRDGDTIILIAENQIHKEMIEFKHRQLLNDTFSKILKKECNVLIKTDDDFE